MSGAGRGAEADGLPPPSRLWAMVAVAVAVAMSVMDSAIANVALPSIARDLGATPAASIWVVNGYQLAVTVSLLPLAALGEIVGYRRVYMAGVAVFTAASLACALADSLVGLTLARVVQGLGGAGVMSINGAVLRFIWPRAMLGRGIGINAVIVATSAAIGPTVAGVILAVADWPWIFAVNVPLGLLALAIGQAYLPHSPRARHRFDVAGAAFSAGTFGLLVLGLDGIAHGQGPAVVALLLAGSAACAALLLRRQARTPRPILPVDLLRIPLFGLSVATSIVSFLAQMMAFASLPFLLQSGAGFTPVQTGLLMTPWPLATAVAAPLAGRLADRVAAGWLGGAGLLLFSAGLLALALMPPVPGALDVAWRMALCGLGFGIFQTPNNRAMIGSAPRERAGGASGMLSTARLLGQTTGAAAVAMVLAHAAQGPRLALYLAAGAALVAAGVSLLRTGRRVR